MHRIVAFREIPTMTIARWGTTSVLALLLACGASTARGQAIDKAILDQVKDATVFVKIKAGQKQGSGSGLVTRVTGDSVLIVTNRHVAAPDFGDLPQGTKVELSVVFRSGTTQEQERPAQLLAFDEDEIRDLAVLEVKQVQNPPRPILADQTSSEADFFETMPVYTLGFPLGGMIQGVAGNRQDNPAVTVTQMTISSLRRDEARRLVRVQLNGSMIEGNSGGPVVDAKGRLVGVAVERLNREAVGFAIPPNVIGSFLAGDVAGLTAEFLGVQAGSAQFQVNLRLIDPLSKLRSVAVRYVRQGNATAPLGQTSATGAWPLLPGGTNLPLTMKAGTAGGKLAVPVAGPSDSKFFVQFVLTLASGATVAQKPVAIMIPDKAGLIAGWGGPPARSRSLRAWSCEVNVTGGVAMKHQTGATTIDLPGGTPLINAPQFRLFSAPAALVQVKGDFIAAARITNSFDPGGDVLMMPNDTKAKMTFQGAGFLLWQDEKNFVRLERCKGSTGGVTLTSRLLVEVYKGGKEAVVSYLNVPEVPVQLVLIRKGGSIQFLFGLPPKSAVVFRELAVDFQDEVFVGVSATNLSKRPFQAKIEDFHLITPTGQEVEVKPVPKQRLYGGEMRTDGTWVYEGATLSVIKALGGDVAPQFDMNKSGGKWTNDRQLLWKSPKMGSQLILEVPGETVGKFDVKGVFTRSPDAAKIKLTFDDKVLLDGKAVDLFEKTTRPGTWKLGTITLTNRKPHRFTLTVQGKNTDSSGYNVGVDELLLVPAR
jgi:S1-C subfamily serine protease/regulation of enolase protein 1 (concanavalin A-like superfamily)